MSMEKYDGANDITDPSHALNPFKSNNSSLIDYEKNLEFRRWLILLVFVLIQITNGGCWATYVGITDQTRVYYTASLSQVLWLANVFLVAYLSLSFLGSWLVYKYFAFSCVTATVVTCLGGWFRVVGGKNINYAICSQFLIAIAQIFILETPALLADRFFHNRERLIATTIGVYSNYAGIGLGYFISPLIVGSDEFRISNLLFIEAIICTVPLALCVLIIKEKPRRPPNFSSTVEKKEFLNSIKGLMTNRHYLISMMCFSFFLGNSWTLTTILDSFLDKSQISQNEVGYLGLVYIFAGTIAGVLASIFLELKLNSKNFVDPLIKVLSTVSTIFLILLSYFVHNTSLIWLFIIMVFLGIGTIGLTPLACISLIETSFPVQESISINVFYFMACVFSFASSNIATIDAFGNYGLFVLVVMQGIPNIYLVGCYSTKFFKSMKEGKYSSFNEGIVVLIIQFSINIIIVATA